ncbi:hypothetical protein [Serinicoccus sediminis]|uniref:hypothetical protein n=1 Tax=Serinicoccus sediminis TaxID=2306021 RepID=UPI0010223BBE|nr:hypothetical protein [Serinicoccus sediminis]
MGARLVHYEARTGPQYDPTRIRGCSWNYGIVLNSGHVAGLDGKVEWGDPGQPSPVAGTWTREAGHYFELDCTDHRGTTRVITGRVDDSSGGTDQPQATSRLTDWTSRLQARLDLRPLGYYMPANPMLTGAIKRKPGLFSWWFTHQALTRAGFYPSQAVQGYSVLYVSMCGSAWPIPDLKHAFAPLGECRQVHRLSDNTVAPTPVPGDECPVTSDVYGLYLTRPTNSVLPWQLTVDLGTATPAPGETGRVSMRRSSAYAGLELDWIQDKVRVYRLNVGGTKTLLSEHERARSGVYRTRWSLVGRPDGTGRLMCEDDTSGNRTWNAVATYGEHGAEMPTGSVRMGVKVEAEGRIGAVQVARADSPGHVERITGATILRAPAAYSVTERSLIAWGYVAKREAGDILALQANAERGLRGLPLMQWIHSDGRLINADFESLQSGARNPSGQPVESVISTTDTPTRLHNLWWTEESNGPWASHTVTYMSMRRSGDNATMPTRLLAQGRQETIERGDDWSIFLKPNEGEIWLEPELRPRLAGHPYGGTEGKYLDRAIGTFLGGSRRDGDGNPQGWLLASDMGWTQDANGLVVGALTMLDPETVVMSGTVNTPAGLDMSTMPSENSAGLPEPRKQQPLPQLRGPAKVTEIPSEVTITVSGNDRHPISTHDCGAWVQRDPHAQYVASEQAEALTDPVRVIKFACSADPWIKPGQVHQVHKVRPDGFTEIQQGVVVRVEGATWRADMTVHMAVTDTDVVAPAEPPSIAPPLPAWLRNLEPPPGFDPFPIELT